MSAFERFIKKNQTVKENTFYPATKSLTDEDGKPLQWEIRALTAREADAIREKCMVDIPVPGKPGQYKQKMSNRYLPSLVCASVVCPDLHNAELQDSYGVHSPEDLLLEMVKSPGEYYDFIQFVQTYSGFDANINEEIEEAKN